MKILFDPRPRTANEIFSESDQRKKLLNMRFLMSILCRRILNMQNDYLKMLKRISY